MAPLLVIGLDGATLDLVRPWAAAGRLPVLADLMDHTNVRVTQSRRSACFLCEATQTFRIFTDKRGQHFQGDVPIEPDVPREVDLAHTAFPDAGVDHIRAETRAGLKCHEAAIIDRGGRNLPAVRTRIV